jgi:hypothetical protein
MGLVLVASGDAQSATAIPTTKVIALSSLGGDLRVALTATEGPDGGGAPPATVRISAYQRKEGSWHRIGRLTVGAPNGWFWNVVTGGHAICQFSTSDVRPYPMEVRLLVSPSIGCSDVTYNFHVEYGVLVPG